MQPPSRRQPPSPFHDKTRAAQPDDDLMAAVRSAPGPGRSVFDEPTRLGDVDADADALDAPTRLGNVDAYALDATSREDALAPEMPTNPDNPAKFLDAHTELSPPLFRGHGASPDELEEATRMAHVNSLRPPPRSQPPRSQGQPTRPPQGRRQPPPPHGSAPDERTRAVDIRNDSGINVNDIDWDLD